MFFQWADKKRNDLSDESEDSGRGAASHFFPMPSYLQSNVLHALLSGMLLVNDFPQIESCSEKDVV